MNVRLTILTLTLSSQMALGQAPELGQGWISEYNLAARQLLSLAEAIPAKKYSWRPKPGVRSISEVFMHISFGNYWLLDQAGGKIPDGTPDILPGFEKNVTAKADVIRWLKNSLDAVKQAYPRTNRTTIVRFLDKDTTSDAVFLRILLHNHEHMGQSIAYARMIGVIPPWSEPGPK